jgi:CDGSH-type Zn-finger protein
MQEPRITPIEDGPLLVSGLTDLRGPDGPLDAPPEYALCRCGASGNKPFCDGSHKRIGFASVKLAERTADRRDDYAGAHITIHDNRGRCAHAGVCTDRLPSVWRMEQEPWIDPDGAPANEVAAVVRACPSGALAYSAYAQDEHEGAPPGASIRVTPNGPYVVAGAFELAGEPAATRRTLCRCGASRNKPLCDGSHWTIEFQG